MLSFVEDKFNGLIVESEKLPVEPAEFGESLLLLTHYAQQNQKAVIWLTLPIALADYVGIAVDAGFVFHTCLANELTLIRKSSPTDIAPYEPTHSIGAGGFVVNDKGELLVIKERNGNTYKLPGGHIELGESLEQGVIREVFEETGIRCKFQSMLGLASTHPYQFGKSNFYFVCQLNPLTQHINIQDPQEIEDAKWMMPSDFIAEQSNSVFNRYLVEALEGRVGLGKPALDLSQFSHRKHELFLANKPT